MSLKNSHNPKKTISLEELVPDPTCLKLLILHTPYTLYIDTIYKCTNLVKLDLSNNSLTNFPYLGHLQNLRLIFIHENMLTLQHLRGIFIKEGEKTSILAKTVIWVTFWGNQNSFCARHFLANETSVLVVDRHMIVPEERMEVVLKQGLQPLCSETNVSEIFDKKNVQYKNITEDEYMKDFWGDIRKIRKKQIQITPILKIQKFFRGWRVREGKQRQKNNARDIFESIQSCFLGWKVVFKRHKKLKRYLKNSNKEHYILPIKQKKIEQIHIKLKNLAQQAKRRVELYKFTKKWQLKFYGAFSKNRDILKELYFCMEVEHSTCIYIYHEQWYFFETIIMPIVSKLLSSQQICQVQNQTVALRYLFENHSKSAKNFIRIVATSMKSCIMYKHQAFTNCRNAKKTEECRNKRKLFQNKQKLSFLYKKVVFNSSQQIKMYKILYNLDTNEKINLSQLKKIRVSQKGHETILRCVYLFNRGLITLQSFKKQHRIKIITEKHAKNCWAAICIQKTWRGYQFRKKQGKLIKTAYKLRKAAIIIQRWIRKLPFNHRKNFMISASSILKTITSPFFLLHKADYFSYLAEIEINPPEKLKFLQQNVISYINHKTKQLITFWDRESSSDIIKVHYRKNKPLFSQLFFKINSLNISNISLQELNSYQKITLSHLLHYNTSCTCLTYKQQPYIQFQFKSKMQCKLRALGYLLMTYSFKWKKNAILFGEQYLSTNDFMNCRKIMNQNLLFVKTKNFEYTHNKVLYHYQVPVKIYINIEDGKKPVKLEETFIIDIASKNRQKKKISYESIKRFENQSINSVLQIKHNCRRQQVDKHFLKSQASEYEKSEKAVKQDKLRIQNKKKLKKKEFRTQKRDKRLRYISKHPNFMLQNVSRFQDRIKTQPDEKQIEQIKISQQSYKYESNKNIIGDYRQRKDLLAMRKHQDSFTKNFINVNNFIQQQYLHENRRKIQTEVQDQAYQAATKVRKSQQKMGIMVQQSLWNKQNYAIKQHQLHQEKMIAHELQLKKSVIKHHRSLDKKNSKKVLMNKLKVSFAEQCYPIVNQGNQLEF